MYFLCFSRMLTIAYRDGGTYLKLANKIQKSLEEVTSIKASTLQIGPFLVLLARWWDIIKYKNAN